MTRLYYTPTPDDKVVEIALEQDETVLDGLLRTGNDVAFGCRSGICQSCLMLSSNTDIPARAQQGLKASLKELGYFLSCLCVPETPLHISHGQHSEKCNARLLEKSLLSTDVLRLRFEKVFDYSPGQFATLWRDQRTARSYSLASVSDSEDFLEFHIKKIANGQFSAWAFEQLTEGDEIDIQGPMGDCFYAKEKVDSPMLLAGIGTGLAPLYGIVRDALQQGHNNKIDLIIAGKREQHFYLTKALLALEQQFSQLSVHFVVQQVEGSIPNLRIIEGDVYQKIAETFPSLNGYKVFLCGAESFVMKMRKQCFLAGASMADIVADSFIAFRD